jgi:transcriptional regulator with XRE-family HTH domain
MVVRKLRLQRGWSQEHLAELTGLSVRTIQRIERGHKPGLETQRALAAVFEIELQALTEEAAMPQDAAMTYEEQQALEYVRDLKGFYHHLAMYVVIVGALFVVNYLSSPHYYWAWWAAMGWGIGVASHAISVFEVFNFLGAEWERKQVEKRLGRKL